MGETLSTEYSRTVSSGSYIGTANTGVFCNSPLAIPNFFSQPMEQDTYQCEAEQLPYTPVDWNPKYYSPLCRPWFQNQREKPDQNTLSDVYVFADSGNFGLTPCAPILKQSGSSN